MAQGTVLMVGSGVQRYREYLMASAAQRVDLWLLEPSPATWQQQYVAGTTVVPLADAARMTPDVDALVLAAADIARHRRIAGVWTHDETLVVAAATIAEGLGVPGIGVDAAHNCRNKLRTRERLTDAGLPQPRFAYAATAAEARAAAAEVGTPLVVKPRGMGASIGVILVRQLEDVERAFETAHRASFDGNPDYEGGVVLESYLTGHEISIDAAVVNGRVHPIFLAHKRTGMEPYFVETGHVVSACDAMLADQQLLDVLQRAHDALGVGNAVTHTELKTDYDKPVIVEVNARLGGDMIPYVGRVASGIDPGRVAIDVALAREPHLVATREFYAGICFGYPPREGSVMGVQLPAPGAVRELVEAAAMTEPGTDIHTPPRDYIGRYAFAICRAATREDCELVLDQATNEMQVELAPLAKAVVVGHAG